MKTCRNCGFEMPDTENFCGQCGSAVYAQQQYAPQPAQYAPPAGQYQQPMYYAGQPQIAQYSNKDTTTTMLLCLFLGIWGVHRFYVGKIGSGIVYFLTAGVFGIGSLIDMFSIAFGSFFDKKGNKLRPSPGGKVICILFVVGQITGFIIALGIVLRYASLLG